MAKKEKIVLQMSPDMEQINGELTTAMDTLDATIERVGVVLSSYEGMQFTAEPDAAAGAETPPAPEAATPPETPTP